MSRRNLAVILILFAPVAAHAHPGHGATDGYGPLHHLVEPEHSYWVLLVLAVVVALGTLARLSRRNRRSS